MVERLLLYESDRLIDDRIDVKRDYLRICPPGEIANAPHDFARPIGFFGNVIHAGARLAYFRNFAGQPAQAS
jgi:hypothetical protein